MFKRNDCFIPVRYIAGLGFRIYQFQEGLVTQLGSDLGPNNDRMECLIHPSRVFLGTRIPSLVPTPVFFFCSTREMLSAPWGALVSFSPLFARGHFFVLAPLERGKC